MNERELKDTADVLAGKVILRESEDGGYTACGGFYKIERRYSFWRISYAHREDLKNWNASVIFDAKSLEEAQAKITEWESS